MKKLIALIVYCIFSIYLVISGQSFVDTVLSHKICNGFCAIFWIIFSLFLLFSVLVGLALCLAAPIVSVFAIFGLIVLGMDRLMVLRCKVKAFKGLIGSEGEMLLLPHQTEEEKLEKLFLIHQATFGWSKARFFKKFSPYLVRTFHSIYR